MEADFGEKLESNETVPTLPPFNGTSSDTMAMMIIVPDDGVEDGRRAVVSPRDVDEYSNTNTEPESSHDDDHQNDNIEDGQFNEDDVPNEEISPSSPVGWNQFGSNYFTRLRGEPITSTYFESNKVEQTKDKQETPQLNLQEAYSKINHLENDHVQSWNEVYPKSVRTSNTPEFDGFLDERPHSYEQNRVERNRLNQIEAAKAYIKQIQFEQEYANGIQHTYQYNQPPPTRWTALGYGPSYRPPSSESYPFPTQTTSFSGMAVHPTITNSGVSFNRNNKNYNPIVSKWNGNLIQFDGSSRDLNGFVKHRVQHPLDNTQWNNAHSNVVTTQMLGLPHPLSQINQGVSSYPGPTANPVVLPSGYLDDTEEVKQAKEIHLRAIGGATQPYSHWRSSETSRPWS